MGYVSLISIYLLFLSVGAHSLGAASGAYTSWLGRLAPQLLSLSSNFRKIPC